MKKIRTFTLAGAAHSIIVDDYRLNLTCHCEECHGHDEAISLNKVDSMPRDCHAAPSAPLAMTCNGKRKAAFTLAETLITLMVIGVVAALTIPALMQVYKDKQLETATKKAMTTVANGFKLMIAENDGSITSLPLLECGEEFACLSGVFHKAFQIGMDKSKSHEGLVEKYTKHDSEEEAGFVWDDVPYIFTTNDGMTYGHLGGFSVVVDINGNKGPNKICKDVIKLTYSSGTITDKVNNSETLLCEELDNPIVAATLSEEDSQILEWYNTPCTGGNTNHCRRYFDYGRYPQYYVDNDDDSVLNIIMFSAEDIECWGPEAVCSALGYSHTGDYGDRP